jgi:hypothetical protein
MNIRKRNSRKKMMKDGRGFSREKLLNRLLHSM